MSSKLAKDEPSLRHTRVSPWPRQTVGMSGASMSKHGCIAMNGAWIRDRSFLAFTGRVTRING